VVAADPSVAVVAAGDLSVAVVADPSAVAAAAGANVLSFNSHDSNFDRNPRRKIMKVPFSMRIIFLMFICLLSIAGTGCAGPQSFSSSSDAVDSLVGALRANDQDQLKKILGPNAQDILSSGDPVSDRNGIERFLAAYDEKHQFENKSEDSVVLDVGNSDWPLPVPIVKDPHFNTWHFDVDAGREELLNRRIGRNELDTIQTCLAVVDAQRDYARMDPEHAGTAIYAAKFLSDPGKKNGLYWPTTEQEPPSPLGELVAAARSEGYTRNAGKPTPFHGYYYRLLTSQGPSAPGGAMNYMVDGKLTRGFGLLAYPAEYGNSGIMSFLVNQNGIVYSCNLGKETAEIASQITAFDPGPDWDPVPQPGTVIGQR
jgi:hypothetical protein